MHRLHRSEQRDEDARTGRADGMPERKGAAVGYLVELDRADRDATAVLPSRVEHLKEKIAKVKEQMHTRARSASR